MQAQGLGLNLRILLITIILSFATRGPIDRVSSWFVARILTDLFLIRYAAEAVGAIVGADGSIAHRILPFLQLRHLAPSI